MLKVARDLIWPGTPNIQDLMSERVAKLRQEQMAALHNIGWLTCDAPSSMAKSRPPMGAPKAADTPAAAPQATKSRFSLSVRKSRKILVLMGNRPRISEEDLP